MTWDLKVSRDKLDRMEHQDDLVQQVQLVLWDHLASEDHKVIQEQWDPTEQWVLLDQMVNLDHPDHVVILACQALLEILGQWVQLDLMEVLA